MAKCCAARRSPILSASLALGVVCLAGCASRIHAPGGLASAQTPSPTAPAESTAPAEPAVPPPPPSYAPGTTVAGVPVGGLDQQNAGHAVRLALKPLSARKLTLRYGQHAYARTWGEVGARPDVDAMLTEAWKSPNVPLSLTVDLGEAKRSIRRAARALDIRPVAPRFVGEPSEGLTKPGKSGRKVDVFASANLLRQAVITGAKVSSVPLVVHEATPPFSEEDLQQVQVPIVKYTTTYNPGESARSNNLRLVARRLNGALILPGQVFSFNDWVGERRASDGFQEAIVYKQGKMVRDLAGGLCQVSSTLYNVALLGGLPIVERSRHSLTVHYVPPGRDATVYWGQHDLRFRNNTRTPLYIRTRPGRRALTIEFWGNAPLDRKVTVTSTSSWRGGKLYAQVYRTVSESGKRKRELISSDMYSRQHVMASSPSGRV